MDLYQLCCVLTAVYSCTCLNLCVVAAEDHYATLGVERTATPKEIKKAFRNMALQYHPDKNKDKDAPAKFQKIVKAYDVLGDPNKRQQYDTGGYFGGGDDKFANLNMEDFFKQFDEVLKGFSQSPQGNGDKHSERSESSKTGGFFDFQSLFSDVDPDEKDKFASFGKKTGQKKKENKQPDIGNILAEALGGMMGNMFSNLNVNDAAGNTGTQKDKSPKAQDDDAHAKSRKISQPSTDKKEL